MAQNTPKDLAALFKNRNAMEQLAGSGDAQTLASLLAKGHDQAELQKMAQSAMSGDTSALQSLIRSITESPEGSELLHRLSQSLSDH